MYGRLHKKIARLMSDQKFAPQKFQDKISLLLLYLYFAIKDS
jgi:hypothetical protein